MDKTLEPNNRIDKYVEKARFSRTVMRDVNEEPKPLTCELKGVHHTNCPFGYVGWGRVREVTTGRNLPRQCVATGWQAILAGRTQSGMLAKPAGRSKKTNGAAS